MFESTAVLEHPGRKHFYVLPVSVAAHALAVSAVILASIWTVETPPEAPAQMRAFIFDVTPPLPPPPPPSQGRRAPVEPASSPEPPRPDTAPAMIPDTTPLPAPDDDVADGDPNGVPGGVPGGLISSVITPSDIPRDPDPDVPMVPGGEVKAPVLVLGAPPAYPRVAVQSRVEGVVVVACVIDTSGTVRDARVVRSAHFLLAPAALDAVRSWRFKPGSFRGHPVSTIYELTVTFKLDRH